MMCSSDLFHDSFHKEVLNLTVQNDILQAREYVQLCALQKFCLHKRLSLADFLSKVDNASDPTGYQTPLYLADVMRGVEYYRKGKKLSKRRLSMMIQMDTGNFMKLYRQGNSINMHTLFRIMDALEVPPSVFMHTCESLLDE